MIGLYGGTGEEEPLFDPQMPITQRKAEVDAFAPGGLVRFVEDGEVEGRARRQARGDDMRRLRRAAPRRSGRRESRAPARCRW